MSVRSDPLTQSLPRTTDGPRDLRSVDKVMLAYLGFTALVIGGFWRAIPHSGWLLTSHAAGIAAILLSARASGVAGRIFREWYPVLYIGGCYKEMSVLIPSLRGSLTMDATLARLDFQLLGIRPDFLLDHFHHPYVTESLQLIYAAFTPGVILVVWLLYHPRCRAHYHYAAFVITLGFLLSFIGYLVVPAYGPRDLSPGAHPAALDGVWAFESVRRMLDWLEGRYADCFPSGHTAMVLLAWWCSRRLSRAFFAGFSVFAACLIFSTVYLSYHYVVDVLAGAGLAAALIVSGPWLFVKLAAAHELPTRGEFTA